MSQKYVEIKIGLMFCLVRPILILINTTTTANKHNLQILLKVFCHTDMDAENFMHQ